MRRAKCFGINLAKLDIRQESSRHSQLLNEFIKKKYNKNYNNWTEKQKVNFLSKSLKSKKQVIKNFKFRNMVYELINFSDPNIHLKIFNTFSNGV